MYRRLQSNYGKTKNAMFTASEVMKKGMLVEKDVTANTVALPASAAGTNVYIVDFVPDPTLETSVKVNMSDYADVNNDIASGDYVSLEILQVGEVYSTDQFTADDIIAGSYLEVGTDGLLAKKATGTSPIVAIDPDANDAGNTVLTYTVTETVYA